MKNISIILVYLAVVHCACVYSTSLSNSSAMITSGAASAIEQYSKDHNGAFPTHVDQLKDYVPLIYFDQLREEISIPSDVLSYQEGQILAFTTRKIVEDRRDDDGRYVVVKLLNNERIVSRWIKEPVFQSIVKNSSENVSSTAWVQPDTKPSDTDYLKSLPIEEQERLKKRLIEEELGGKVEREKNKSLRSETSASVHSAQKQPPVTTSSESTTESAVESASFPWLWIGTTVVIAGAVAFLTFQRQRS